MRFILFCLLVLLACMQIFQGCYQDKFYRTETGLLYKVIESKNKDSVAGLGVTAKIHYTQKAGDSVLESTYKLMPLYHMVVPGYGNRYNPLEVFDYGLKEGDSVVTIQRVDSMMRKKIFTKLPAFLKPTDLWYTYFKVVKLFRNDSLLHADKMQELERVAEVQAAEGKGRIENYLTRNR